jgi:uncharacterized protein (DUF433 family)
MGLCSGQFDIVSLRFVQLATGAATCKNGGGVGRSVSSLHDTAAKRGVYSAERASALAGVPRSTVYYWGRKGVLAPSVSWEKLKLWSWADLVALRAVYWLRHPAPDDNRKPTPMRQVRALVEEVEGEIGKLGEALSTRTLTLRVDPGGVPYIETAGRMVEGRHHWRQQVEREIVIDLLSSFAAEGGLRGPDLVRPREGLRIIPGKLSGEPHIENTRIETRVLWTLSQRGYSSAQLHELYEDAPLVSIERALDLESQLERNLLAA